MSEDWLDITDGVRDEKAGLPAVVNAPLELAERIRLAEECWSTLNLHQRTFLTAWRENRFNARKTARKLGLSVNTRPMTVWMQNPQFATVVQIWRGSAAQEALDKDRLILRQDDIVETLLKPKPILYQGEHTGFEEVDASAASKANEVLLDRVMPKPRADVEVNVGVAFMPPNVEVEVVKTAGAASGALDAAFVEVSPVLPEEDWLE